MTSDRIKEIQQKTAYPGSVSVKGALLTVWNECEQENSKCAERIKIEYSDQECISFADWILKNCFWHDGWNCMIEKYDDTYTTAELLTIYKKENE